jgi:signal transduction histidine kinase
MSLTAKTTSILCVLALCLLIAGYAVQRIAVYPAFDAYERQSTLDSVARVRDALKASLVSLEVMNVEYSYWDEMYRFARGEAEQFREEYLQAEYLADSDIDLFVVFDTDAHERFRFVDGATDDEAPRLEDVFVDALTLEHPLLRPRRQLRRAYGYLRTRTGVMQVVSYSIVMTSGEGEDAGILVTGRYLSDAVLARLGDAVTARLSIFDPLHTPHPGPAGAAAATLAAADGGTVELGPDNENAYFLIRDLFDEPAALLRVSVQRSLAELADSTLTYATLLLGSSSLFFILATGLMMRRFVIAPLRELTGQIGRIRQTGNLSVDFDPDKSDEIGTLARDFGVLAVGLREVQTKLEKARDEALVASEMKSEFLARMSHEIRTPMNGVLGMTEVLRTTPLSDRQTQITETIYESGSSLLHIIDDILDFSKIEAGRIELAMTDTSLPRLIETTVEPFRAEARRKGVELSYSLDSPPEDLLAMDPVRVRQVLNNLLGNALKFTSEGRVLLRVSCESVGEESVRADFEVQDSGIGIDPARQGMIFESFTQEDGSTTRKYGGTGLGLAISKQLVELMGGELTVRSSVGRGSCFSFSLLLNCAGSPVSTTPDT